MALRLQALPHHVRQSGHAWGWMTGSSPQPAALRRTPLGVSRLGGGTSYSFRRIWSRGVGAFRSRTRAPSPTGRPASTWRLPVTASGVGTGCRARLPRSAAQRDRRPNLSLPPRPVHHQPAGAGVHPGAERRRSWLRRSRCSTSRAAWTRTTGRTSESRCRPSARRGAPGCGPRSPTRTRPTSGSPGSTRYVPRPDDGPADANHPDPSRRLTPRG